MIKLVVFDAGDVLYKSSKKNVVKEVVSSFLVKHGIKDLENALRKAREAWLRVEKLVKVGKMGLREAQEKWLEALGLNKKLVDEWMEIEKKEIRFKLFKRTPEVNETLKILRKKYKLAILSDTVLNKEELIQKLQALKIDYEFFDEIFTSHDIGYEKPHREAYLTVLRHFNVKPYETVFVGHAKDEIEGAKKIGLITIVVGDRNVKGDYFIKQFKDLIKILDEINLP
ncbi:MAG: HAD family hydrolase [Candidatus Baldrarchaeia archaeon]